MADDKLEVIKKIDQALMSAGRLLLQQLNKVSIKAKEEISKLDPNSPTLAEDKKRINSEKFDAIHELKARYQKTKEFLGKHKKALVIGTAVVGTTMGGIYAYGKYKEHKRKKQKATNMETYNMTGLEKRFHKNLGWALYGIGFSDKPTTIVNFLKENEINEEIAVLLLNTVDLMEDYTLKKLNEDLSDYQDELNAGLTKNMKKNKPGVFNASSTGNTRAAMNRISGAAAGARKSIVGAATRAGGSIAGAVKPGGIVGRIGTRIKQDLERPTPANAAGKGIPAGVGQWAKHAATSRTAKVVGGTAAVTAAALGARALWKRRQAKKAAEAQTAKKSK